MSQFAREHPEDYEERLEAMVDAADLLRKERKENPCPACLGTGNGHKEHPGGYALIDCAICRGRGTG